MQVTAGKFKGKKLQIPPLDLTRPTKSIVKQSFFNSLSFRVQNLCFVEMFAGSGSMGIEALSRGAIFAVFFEKQIQSFKTLNKNLESLNITNYKTIKGDVFVEFARFISTYKGVDLWLYLDPPFNIRQNQENVYEKTIDLISKINNKSVVGLCIEHISSLNVPPKINLFILQKTKKFGKTSLSYYEAS